MKTKKIVLFIIIIFLTSCVTRKDVIYYYKGFLGDSMKKKLKPMILPNFKPIEEILGINKQNYLAAINKKGEFCLLEIDEAGVIIDMNPIIHSFPSDFGSSYHSDNEHNVLWQIEGRGFTVLDIKTEATGDCIVSYNADDKVLNSFLVDADNKIFLIDMSRLDRNTLCSIKGFLYVLYDLNKNKIIFESPIYGGTVYPFNNNLLFCEYIGEKHDMLKWYIIDFYLDNKKENKLTKKLTKMQIKAWDRSKTIHTGRRMMLGTSRLSGSLEYFSIRWDEDFEDIRIEPIILQKPNGKRISSRFEFSPDGNWVKTLKFADSGVTFPPELIIYHVGEVYPQGLSMPILCGYTKEINTGAFMNHSEWGPCYVELDYEFNNKLFVYKLNDGLKILAEQAKDAVK